MVETALSQNTKIVVPSNTDLMNLIGDLAGILPFNRAGRSHSPAAGGPTESWDERPSNPGGNGGSARSSER